MAYKTLTLYNFYGHLHDNHILKKSWFNATSAHVLIGMRYFLNHRNSNAKYAKNIKIMILAIYCVGEIKGKFVLECVHVYHFWMQ